MLNLNRQESDRLLSDERSYGGTSSTTTLSESPLSRPSQESSVSLTSFVLLPNTLLYPPSIERSESQVSLSSAGLSKQYQQSNSSRRTTRRLDSEESLLDADSATPESLSIDERRIYQAAREGGRYAFGIVAVDVWLLEQHGRFVHSVLWVSPVFEKRHPSEALSRVLNPQHPQYAQPIPQVPGAGLAGYFWAMGPSNRDGLLWRELHAITSDPFQPPYTRMKVLEEAGFGKATGVAFDIMGQRGVVVYLARESASSLLLNETSNVEYLRASAQHIGTACALTKFRQASAVTKETRTNLSYRRIVTNMQCASALLSLHRSVSSKSLRSLDEASNKTMKRTSSFHVLVGSKIQSFHKNISQTCQGMLNLTRRRVDLVYKKSRGSNLKPPPGSSWTTASWTFVGSFATFAVLYALGQVFATWTGHALLLAPFGALLTLQYSLFSAPVSQPRNVLYGQAISLSTALFIQQWHLPLFLSIPLAGAAGIALMTKVGCTHPPAAAAIVALFSGGSFSILTVIVLLFGNLVAIVLAIVINNLSEQRQYPVYWQLGWSNYSEEAPVAYLHEYKSRKQNGSTPPSRNDTEDGLSII